MFKLATLFNFYCTTLLGGIEHMKKINEAHLSHMLPSLFYGLSVDCLDLNASVFIILTLISTKTAFEISLLHKLVYKIVKVKYRCCYITFIFPFKKKYIYILLNVFLYVKNAA